MARGRPRSPAPGSPGYVPPGARLISRNVGSASARLGYEAPLPVPPYVPVPGPPPPEDPLYAFGKWPPTYEWYVGPPASERFPVPPRVEIGPAPPPIPYTEGKWDYQRGIASDRDLPTISLSEALAAGAPGLFVSDRTVQLMEMAAANPSFDAAAGRALWALTRAFPYASAGWLIWELWKWVNRTKYGTKTYRKAGSAPGPWDPYVPPGWKMTDDWAFNPYWYAVHPEGFSETYPSVGFYYNYFGVPGSENWVDIDVGLAFGALDESYPYSTTQTLVRPFPGSGSGYGIQNWVRDAQGQGNLIPGRIDLDPEPWPEADTITEAMPEIDPFVPPMWAPPQWRVLPRPGRVIDIDPDPVVSVESPPIPDEPVEAPAEPDVDVQISGSGVTHGPTTHTVSPPPPRTRESKLKSKMYWVLRGVARRLGRVTEWMDFVEQIHKSLPRSCQRSRHWVGPGGKFHRKKVSSMLRDIYNCSAFIDADLALRNLVMNEVQDWTIARLNRATFMPGFSQMPGTTIHHSQQLGEAYSPSWWSPFGDPWTVGYRLDRSPGGQAGLRPPNLRPQGRGFRYRRWARR